MGFKARGTHIAATKKNLMVIAILTVAEDVFP